MGDQSHETFILINPKARYGITASHWDERKKEILSALNLDEAETAFTRSDDHGAKVVKEALKKGAQRIVVVGGDGTISEAIQGFFEEGKAISPEAVLMVMPGGRGDDYFKSMSHQFDLSSRSAWKKGLSILQHGRPHSVDVGRIHWLDAKLDSHSSHSRYFMNVASFGFPSLVVHRLLTQQGKLSRSFLRKSAWVYVLEGLLSANSYQPISVTVKVDDQDFYQGPIAYGFVLNGRYNSGGICWHPDTRIDDGLFHIRLIQPSSFWGQMKRVSKVILGGINPIPGVWNGNGKKVEVRLMGEVIKKHPFFEVDGDTPESEESRGAIFEVMPAAIRLQMPTQVF